MVADYDPVRYKISSMQNWNTVAHCYHNDWASKGKGPFGSTAQLVKAANIRPFDSVLDVACGTGAVSTQAARLLGLSGTLVGIDFSRTALEIAKSSVTAGHFFEMDVEHIGLRMGFDKILCQYALMFFPDPTLVIRRLYDLAKVGGRLVAAVHGTAKDVPYFSTVMEPVIQYIPDIRPPGTPTVHRFGNPSDLQKVIVDAGFSQVSIKELTFDYEAGTFEEYWLDYMSTTANAVCATIESKGSNVVALIKSEAEQKAKQYIEGSTIHFPWKVLIATAIRAQE